jgi:DNA modification methylase
MGLVHAAERAAITPGRTNMWLYDNAVDVGCYYQPAATSMSYWGRATWQPILFYGRDPYIGKKIQPLHYQLTEKPSCPEHPCSKPQQGWDWLVDRSSKPDELVIDPFMGSGTTGVSCSKRGQRFIGFEIDERYFDIACKRIEQEQRQERMAV